jgi:hypothetical protein
MWHSRPGSTTGSPVRPARTADRDALKELAVALKTKGDFAEAAQSLKKAMASSA